MGGLARLKHSPALAGAAVLVLAAAAAGCRADPTEPELQSTVQTGSDVVLPAGDLVYRYLLSSVNADSLLHLMRADGVPVREAWQPLEDLCADPIGPRFTVALSRPFEEITAYHFEPGTGIRACTTKVRHYTWGS
jgi:hypothetical protein